MARVLARLESPVEDLPFKRTEDLDRLTGSQATLASSKWLTTTLEQSKGSGEDTLQDSGLLLIELDDGSFAVSSFQYYQDNQQGGNQ